MYSHVTLGYTDFERSRAFYDAVMQVLGHPTLFAFEEQGMVAYGDAAGRSWGAKGVQLFTAGDQRPVVLAERGDDVTQLYGRPAQELR